MMHQRQMLAGGDALAQAGQIVLPDFAQHLAVQTHRSLLEAGHEGRVVDVAGLARGGATKTRA